jgi:sugar/nucleoside kinase (ribokinase family)
MVDVLVTGHLCLDVIPSFPHGNVTFKPGHLTEVGAATFATGGGMSNVGLALIRLGVSTKLVGKIGDDFFGDAIIRVLESYDKNATKNLITEKGGSSSYTRWFSIHPITIEPFCITLAAMIVLRQATLIWRRWERRSYFILAILL